MPITKSHSIIIGKMGKRRESKSIDPSELCPHLSWQEANMYCLNIDTEVQTQYMVSRG